MQKTNQEKVVNKNHSRMSLSGISTLFSKQRDPRLQISGMDNIHNDVMLSPADRKLLSISRLLSRCHFTKTTNSKKKGGPELRPFRMTTCFNNAFTLIELLVVVLIIGILAAIALPQYQIAVEKTRFSNYRTLASAIGRATDIFYLANNAWPKNFEEIDVQLPADFTLNNDKTCGTTNDLYCCYSAPSSLVTGSVSCGNKKYSLSFAMKFAEMGGARTRQFQCRTNTDVGQKVCLSLGGKFQKNTTIISPKGFIPATLYKIE